jgi:hypothetical protein
MNRILLFFLVAFATCQAQSISRTDEHLLFKEAKSSQAILVLNDSLFYKGNALQPKYLIHTPYPSVLKSYIPLCIKDKSYLVYQGCGVVLEWRNDSIVRIDKSFLHKNQYGAVPFAYNKKIFFWGGYGLFTHKNILTQFNLITKEWDEVETFGTPPSPRRQSHGIVIANYFYVFSGYEKDEKIFHGLKDSEPIVWRLDLQTMQWTKLGQYVSINSLNSKDAVVPSFTINHKLYIIPVMQFNKVIEIDFNNNTVTTFKGITKNVYHPYFDYKTNEVVYINKNADDFKSVIRTPLQEFLGKQVSQEVFILPWYLSLNPITIIGAILLGVLAIVLILYVNKRKSRFAPFNGITFHSSAHTFYYRGKPLDTLEDAELRILDYLVLNRHRFISLNELNHLFENEVQKDSFLTVVKRREVALSSLLAKLIFITTTLENEILDYRKSANDKRVKEIKLKDSFIKVK